jgi:2-polyprenyl-3-methyl-5-hydroxy-6-metoxy-1,4-benzoquinol methylase
MVTTSVADHYESHLGPIYSWMLGDIDAALARSDLELESLGLPSRAGGTAIDLGAGFGMHTLPLARRGFSVVALDTYQPLLDELLSRAGSLPIRTVNANLLAFREHIDRPTDAILCMGDTLTHLPDTASVESLFTDVAASLKDGGIFAATFRDYVSTPLQGDGRFILVRGDEHRILTCFLEYADKTVTVHDVLHEREGGQWRLRVSSYPKLRLSPAYVAGALSSHGLRVQRQAAQGGMVCIIARKSASA